MQSSTFMKSSNSTLVKEHPNGIYCFRPERILMRIPNNGLVNTNYCRNWWSENRNHEKTDMPTWYYKQKCLHTHPPYNFYTCEGVSESKKNNLLLSTVLLDNMLWDYYKNRSIACLRSVSLMSACLNRCSVW